MFGCALVSATLALTACSTTDPSAKTADVFEFGLIGDMPYTDEATTNAFPRLIADMNRAGLAFSVHDGDFKSGSTPCTDEVFLERKGQFDLFADPLVFIFGDNEWQDCGNNRTNRFDPLERLAKLRELFASGTQTLGRRKMNLTRQSAQYPENVRWAHGKVLFAGFNMPGGANHFGNAEFAARNEANCAWLQECFALATSEKRLGVVLIIQANPHFDLPATNQVRRGFNQWLNLLQKETLAFGKPVVLVHGDTHYFRIDKPMISSRTGRRIEHFTRVETFGYPDVHWLRARVNPRDPNLFSFQIELVDRNIIHRAP